MAELKINQLRKDLSDVNNLSIVGTSKNVGKTTTLNFILKILDCGPLGLTSVGRDGEETDVVTKTKKPKIFITSGTIVATAKRCILESRVSLKILKSSDIETPLGKIYIAKAISCGFVELAGPSTLEDLVKVIKKIRECGALKVIIDGALSRKSLAVPKICDGCVFSTGGAFIKEAVKLANTTANELKLLSIEKTDDSISVLFDKLMENLSLAFIYKDHVVKSSVVVCFDSAKEIIEAEKSGLNYIFLKGAVVDTFVEEILKSGIKLSSFKFIVEDGTKLFLSEKVYRLFLARGGELQAARKINICAITLNPTSTDGELIDEDKFYSELKMRLMGTNLINVPVLNVKKQGLEVIE